MSGPAPAVVVVTALALAVGVVPGGGDLLASTETAIEHTESGRIEAAFFYCPMSGETSVVVVGENTSRGVNPWPVEPDCAPRVLVHTHPTGGGVRLSAIDRTIPAAMDVSGICAVSLDGDAACLVTSGSASDPTR